MQAILQREEISETGIDNGLAIPHGKADCVKEPAFAVLTTNEIVPDWESIVPENEVRHIIMLAIPKAEGGSTHLDLLAEMMGRMADEGYTSRLFASQTSEEFYKNLDADPSISEEAAPAYKKTIVAVTACAAGIAHTYMAAEALVKAGKEMGVRVLVEKQGANGVEDRHTSENLKSADAADFKRFRHQTLYLLARHIRAPRL